MIESAPKTQPEEQKEIFKEEEPHGHWFEQPSWKQLEHGWEYRMYINVEGGESE